MRADDQNKGPLKIIKLPTATAPIMLMSETPRTLRNLGLKGVNYSRLHSPRRASKTPSARRELCDFEFHDVNEDYEGLQRMNRLTEMRMMALSLQEDPTT